MKYELLPHQYEAINAIKKCYSDRSTQKCGIVSIPTGGGKTYVAVYWINTILIVKKTKIIWFAQSFELLNQAYECMKENLDKNLKIRRISSEKGHSKVKDIKVEDDIILITTQSAIKNATLDNEYSAFVNKNKENLVCILDEAHHAPANGFRKMIMEVKLQSENLWLLGLTATPTYTNESRRGWLWKIFEQGVIYEVEKRLLQQQGILAKENFKYIITPTKIKLTEEDYVWLAKKHREIPEHIIEELVGNKIRNEFIILQYIKNRKIYGKTIIFLDRWYQCEYMKEEFQKYGITCEAIYSFNNDRKKSNSEIIQSFRENKFEVLLNVKMLTEGADIPTVKTVFISHETQSYILFNQMVGRCLRGERAGGKKKVANVILFGDKWDKSIAWYIPTSSGALSEERIEKNSHPIYTFSLTVLSELNKALSKDNKYIENYSTYIPVGWYIVNYIEFLYDDTDTIRIIEDYASVSKKDKEKFDSMIEYLIDNKDYLNKEWKKENFDETRAKEQVQELCDIFMIDINDIECYTNMIKITRHIAQNEVCPEYVNSNLELDTSMKRVFDLIKNEIPEKQINILSNEYSKPGEIWADIYETFFNFKIAVDLNLTKYFLGEQYKLKEKNIYEKQVLSEKHVIADLKDMIKVVKSRDGSCKCCGINGKNIKLFVEPINLAIGFSSVRNMQTLCSRCKKNNKNVNFNNNITIYNEKQQFQGVLLKESERKSILKVKAALRASINMMYQCGAIFDIRFINKKEGKICEIIIFKGNPINWIENQKDRVLQYINEEMNQRVIIDIIYKIIQ